MASKPTDTGSKTDGQRIDLAPMIHEGPGCPPCPEEQERSKYRVLIENAHEAIYVAQDGFLKFANAKTREITGYPLDVLASRPFHQFIHPDDRETVLQRHQQRIQGIPAPSRYSFRILNASGKARWVELNVTRIHWEDKPATLNFLNDITDRRRAEFALKKSERNYRYLFENAPIGIFRTNIRGKVLTINSTMARLLGFDTPQKALAHYSDLGKELYTDPAQRQAFLDLLHEKGAVENFEYQAQTVDGKKIWLTMNARMGREKTDNSQIIEGFTADITHRKQAEEALRASEEKFRLLVENTRGIIFSLDLQGCFTYVSPSAEALMGYSARELTGRSFTEFIHPDHLPFLMERFQRVLQGQDLDSDYRIVNKEGEIRWVHSATTPIIENGQVVSLQGVLHDITERIRAEEEKARLMEQARQAQRVEAIGRLAGGVAHDLNNLLSPILGYAEILMEDLKTDDFRRESVDEIFRAGFRARDLVRQLLAFSRKQALEYRPVNLNQAITDFEKLLRRTIREDIEIQTVLAPDMATVRGDIGQLEQVIMNLSVNAQDAMPHGGKLVLKTAMAWQNDDAQFDCLGTRKPGDCAILAVSDTGTGIDDAVREHIFEPFFSTKGELGTGLGLATVYGIVKQHGGDIQVYSQPNQGTTIKIFLPVDGSALGEEATEKRPVTAAKGAETILLAEDNEQVRTLAKTVLKRKGYNLLVARNGKEALSILSSHGDQVHLLLTDVVMPGINGKELYALAAKAHPDLKVLYMSGYTDKVILNRGVAETDVEFIEKPFTIQDLSTRVREILSGEKKA